MHWYSAGGFCWGKNLANHGVNSSWWSSAINVIKDSKLICYLQQSHQKAIFTQKWIYNVVLGMVETKEMMYFTPVACLMLFLAISLPNLSVSMLIGHQNFNQIVSNQYFGLRIRECNSPWKSLNIFFIINFAATKFCSVISGSNRNQKHHWCDLLYRNAQKLSLIFAPRLKLLLKIYSIS